MVNIIIWKYDIELEVVKIKSYEQVIAERYDGRETEQKIYDNVYSLINPIGFYGHINIENIVYEIIQLIRNRNIDISQMKILDVGCGSGWITRLLAEFTGNPYNITGIDLSKYRTDIARSMFTNIEYINGDIVKECEFKHKFDLITSFDVFMHLGTEEEIEKALKNIYNNLNNKGIFVWYDAYAKDHFNTLPDAECQGFSSFQMNYFAEKVGLVKIHELSLYKLLFGRVHSLYLCDKLPNSIVRLLEKIIPGSPGNMVKIFIKE